MSQFQATKCDECGRIRGEANHWIKVFAVKNRKAATVGIIVGELGNNLMPAGVYTSCTLVERDLCGDECAIKHITAVMKASVPVKAEVYDERATEAQQS